VTLTVLEPEGLYPDTALEQGILGPDVRILQGNAKASLAELPDSLLAGVEGLMTLRMAVPAEQIARMPKLKVVVRMGVGYDRVDRAACAARGITVCNVPDYGTQEVAEFAVLLALSLRRGLILYHETQRGPDPADSGGDGAGDPYRAGGCQQFDLRGLPRGTAGAGDGGPARGPHRPAGGSCAGSAWSRRNAGRTRIEHRRSARHGNEVSDVRARGSRCRG